ncbi:MAG: FadR family transcriptional regulator [Lachnospiraceae bacterium]|nr:FadR family transcriptional regulator [Lachnospiraceae bacterium]
MNNTMNSRFETEKKPVKARTGNYVNRVIQAITDEIINGSLHPGDRLAPESELAKKYDVGRNTVREAIKQLQAYGVLYIKRADGTYIEDSFNEKMLDPVLYNLIYTSKDQNDLVQLRSIIETGIIHLAMENEHIGDVLPKLVEYANETEKELKKEEPSPDRVLELDLAFHSAIAGTIENPQVNVLTSYIARMTVPSRKKAVEEWIRLGKQDEFIELHRDIINVIKNRDFSKINEVVNNHYVFLRKVLNKE